MLCKEKKAYKSKHEALKHSRISFFSRRKRVYQCEECFNWHITNGDRITSFLNKKEYN